MTPEGQLLAALSHLESAYKSAMKAAILYRETDPERAEYIDMLGAELLNEYLGAEEAALTAGRNPQAPLPS